MDPAQISKYEHSICGPCLCTFILKQLLTALYILSPTSCTGCHSFMVFQPIEKFSRLPLIFCVFNPERVRFLNQTYQSVSSFFYALWFNLAVRWRAVCAVNHNYYFRLNYPSNAIPLIYITNVSWTSTINSSLLYVRVRLWSHCYNL